MRFIYSLIRFVPDPARGEFVNVGAIVGSELSSEWQLRQVSNPARARALDDERSLDVVWAFCNRVGTDIDRFDESLYSLFDPEVELSEDWLENLHTQHRNIVQLSPPTPMVANSADEALDRLFSQMILDPTRHRSSTVTKHGVLAAMRRAYGSCGLGKNRGFVERARLSTSDHSIPVDFAVVNGEALQLVQTWSFQSVDQQALAQQVRSWGWVVHRTRNQGGRLDANGVEGCEVDPDVAIVAVYVPPATDGSSGAYRGALDVFKETEIEHRSIDQVKDVAEEARRLLAEASA
ncbi:MAG: DUF3037 domain-containing protein [bacterium]|nr:DUF3037 domain-containing protein [bacterium]MDE0288645.1 DUF3037 domain-containing protein [bacterium]MDE0439863.1 DUF3037 domain-containing protein [bacterium]